MRTLLIFLALFTFEVCFSQTSMSVDSSTVVTASFLDSNDSRKILEVYSYEYEANIYKRLDTIKYDYAFIQASICKIDSSYNLIEVYFLANDTIPKRVFRCGREIELENTTYNFKFTSLINEYSNLKNIQTVPYNKTQIWIISSNNKKGKFIKNRKNKIKNTYQIQTFVDKKKKNIIVSLQTPPKNPKFKTIEKSPRVQITPSF